MSHLLETPKTCFLATQLLLKDIFYFNNFQENTKCYLSFLQSSSITPNMSSSSAQGGQLESMLGDLQSDLSKQGVTTKTKGLCAACNQPVVGQVSENI